MSNLAQKVDLEIFRQNRLTVGMLISKLPLIFIVASGKLYSDWQIGVIESKYGITSSPLFTGRGAVMWPTFWIMGCPRYHGNSSSEKLQIWHANWPRRDPTKCNNKMLSYRRETALQG